MVSAIRVAVRRDYYYDYDRKYYQFWKLKNNVVGRFIVILTPIGQYTILSCNLYSFQ